MKKLASVIALFCFITSGFAQKSSTPPDFTLGQLNVTLQNPPRQVNFGSAVNSGNPGPASYYYWVVSNYAIGNSTPAGPFIVTNGPNTLSSGSGVTVSWRTSSGAISYDLLRTSTSAMPVGACNCAVAAGVTGSSTTDQSNTLNAYTVSTFDPSTVLWAITNESVSSGVSQITFRVGGIAKFSLASNGGAVTLPTPATAPAHQFFNALSGGGTFSSAQPASADISDGTGTGVVVRTASPAISSPTITGTVAGGASYTAPTITNPTTTGTDSGAETFTGKTYGGTTHHIQVFTSSGTFTIPSNITGVEVTVLAGGGGGGGSTATINGGGGGSASAGIKALSGLTPGNTLTVTVGGAGAAGLTGATGGTGGASSVSSGTQTITSITTNGGAGGAGSLASSPPGGGGGAGTGGDLNLTGSAGGTGVGGNNLGGTGAGSILGGGAPESGGAGVAGTSFGAGGGGAGGAANNSGGAGSAGVVIFKWVN
ncbi:MAG: hypothetical protein ACJ71W_06040 [Terriglobales bacterium]